MSRRPRAGDSTSVVGLRLTQSERDALAKLVARAGPGATASSVIRELIAHGESSNESSERGYVEARHGRAKPEFVSGWSPRFVWTLHMVPGRPHGPPLCVRRRVLNDFEDFIRFEVGGRPTGSVDGEKLCHGVARTLGSSLFDERVGTTGCEVCIWVYDHCPTDEERAEWVRRHAAEQSVLRTPPKQVWACLPGLKPGGPDVAVACSTDRPMHRFANGDRDDLSVRLPGYRDPKPGEFYRNRIDVNLLDLAVAGRVEVVKNDGRVRAVYLKKPSAADLAREGRERDAKAQEGARNAAEAKAWAESLFGLGRKQESEDEQALRYFGLDRSASLEDLKRARNQRVQTEHPDKGGSDATMRTTIEMFERAKRYLESSNGKKATHARA